MEVNYLIMKIKNTNLNTNFIKIKTSFLAIIFVFIFSATFLAAPASASSNKEVKSAVKSEKKENKKKTGVKSSKSAVIQDSDDEIIALEDDELEIDGDEQISENKKTVNPKTNKTAKDNKSNSKAESGALKSEKAPSGEDKKAEFSFNYTTESRIDKINRDRLKDKVFLEKISNDYFKIYADEDDFIVIADFPYGKDNTAHTIKFIDEHKLVVTFKNKSNNALAPVRYEISFPEATKKEVFDFSVRDKLELIVPIDFFYAERKNFR